MKVVWLVIGIGIGVAAARSAASGSAREFGRTLADSYRARRAELTA